MLDIAVNNARVYDPERKCFFAGCVGVANGAIAVVSGLSLCAATCVDAAGRVLCPGFIDPHAHMDGAAGRGDPSVCAAMAARQGVTTAISGNCGFSATPDGFAALMANGFPINQAELAGHETLRRGAGLSDPHVPAGDRQIDAMASDAERALAAGFAGISFGLGYVPGAGRDEVYRLARIAARAGKPVAIDTRMDTPSDLSGLAFALNMARDTGVRVIISHFVYQYGGCGGLLTEAHDMVARARLDGADAWADSGLYTQWATDMGAWMFREEFIVANPGVLDGLRAITGEHRGERMTMALYRHMRARHAKDSVACMTGCDQSALDALMPDYVMPSSDAAPFPRGQGHPQAAGSFAKYLRHVFSGRLIAPEEALWRATLLPATIFGLMSKGRMRVGCDADLVLFDPETVCDRAAFLPDGAPDAPCAGVICVIVGGRICFENGMSRGLCAGRAAMLQPTGERAPRYTRLPYL